MRITRTAEISQVIFRVMNKTLTPSTWITQLDCLWVFFVFASYNKHLKILAIILKSSIILRLINSSKSCYFPENRSWSEAKSLRILWLRVNDSRSSGKRFIGRKKMQLKAWTRPVLRFIGASYLFKTNTCHQDLR